MIGFELTHAQVKELLKLYKKTGNIHSFIKCGLDFDYDLSERELSLIWQAFDAMDEERYVDE